MFTHFDPESFRRLFAAGVDAGLATQVASLTRGIDRGFVAGAPYGNNAREALWGLLDYLNHVERLRDGSVPMETFLHNAALFAEPGPAASVIEAARDQIAGRATQARKIDEPTATAQARALAARVLAAGGLERIIGRDDTLSFSFLAAGQAVGRAVVKLIAPKFTGGDASQAGQQILQSSGEPLFSAGTGWLVTGSLLVTNHHVVNVREGYEPDAGPGDLRAQVAGTKAVFDFDADSLPGTTVPVAGLEAWSKELDYAVLRLEKPVDRAPLRPAKAPLCLGPDSIVAVNIIQHPRGGPKRVALRSNLLVSADEREIRYITDTEPGSSGSPVCDDQWRVVALHRAWTRVAEVVIDGKRTSYVNTGVPMAAILADLQTRYPAIFAQLTLA